MNILLTNDDGIYADGIAALYRALRDKGHQVSVVAPSTQQSAVGHAITFADPLRVASIDMEPRIAGYAVQGTPADCVKIAVNALGIKPDFVVSGINHGANTGHHVIYSGTVSAATEATMFGFQSIAVSLDMSDQAGARYDFTYAAQFAANLCDQMIQHGGFPVGTLLNVNVPGLDARQIKGVKVGKLARFQPSDTYEKRVDPRNRVYYWLKDEEVVVTDAPELEVDYRLLKNGYIVLTPIHYDLTDYNLLTGLQEWTFPL